MKFSTVILAGGKSSRMGRDKAWLERNGQPLLARQIQLARECNATEILISGRAGQDYTQFNCQVVTDNYPEAGPLAGIESALAYIQTPMLLVLAVDMPSLYAELLRGLLSACHGDCGAAPLVNDRLEPLAAFYPKSAHQLAREMLGGQKRGLQFRTPGPTDFARECVARKLLQRVQITSADHGCFRNLNTPEDLLP